MITPPQSPAGGTHRETSATEIAGVREALKRCSAATVDAACQYRTTRDPSHIDGVVTGVIERYVERQFRPKLDQHSADLRLVEDLGLDSLTLMEISLLLEDVLQVAVSNEDLVALRTTGDIRRLIGRKTAGAALSPQTQQR